MRSIESFRLRERAAAQLGNGERPGWFFQCALQLVASIEFGETMRFVRWLVSAFCVAGVKRCLLSVCRTQLPKISRAYRVAFCSCPCTCGLAIAVESFVRGLGKNISYV